MSANTESASPDDDQPLRDDPLLKQVPEVEGYKVLEPCVLYAKVGEGGMGAVYRGRHLNLDIDVAIKCLKNVLAEQSPAFVTRFQREARIAASVHHQNLVQVYDISHKNGVHYLVMEFVKGETARERVTRKRRLSESEACKVMVGAASGLAEAHGQRIVHRDIKPDNILISFDGKVKVSDLGLAKALELDGSPSLTMGVMGTPQYMAPEQWDDAATVGPQADVWALGATFYFLLTGEHAIPGGSMQQIYKKICVDAFPDISQKLPKLSAEVKAILDKCVQRDPKQRYADCRELLRDLGKLTLKESPHLADAESGTLKVPPLLSPPPAETLGHIKVAIQGEDGGRVDLSRRTPAKVASKAELTAPPIAPVEAAKPAVTGGPKWAWGLAAVVPVLVLGWWAFVRDNEKPREVRGSEGPSEPSELLDASPNHEEESTEQDGPFGAQEAVKKDQPQKEPGDQITGVEAITTSGDGLADVGTGSNPKVEAAHLIPVLRLDELTEPYLKVPALVISGSVEHGEGSVAIRCSDPTVAMSSPVITNDEGRFKLDLTLPREGEYSFWISAGEAIEQKRTVVYDSSPPTIRLLSALPERTKEAKVRLSLEVKDAYSKVESVWISIRGETVLLEQSQDSWLADLALQERENELTAHARDSAGHERTSQYSIVLDTEGPRLENYTPTKGTELLPKETDFTLVYNEELVSLEINGQPAVLGAGEIQKSGRVTLPVGLDQNFVIKWIATDDLGNSSNSELEWPVRSQLWAPSGMRPVQDQSDPGITIGNLYVAKKAIDDRTGIVFILIEPLQLYVAETEVTVGQFKKWPKGKVKDGLAEDLPVTGVSWKEANEYCVDHGYALPTREQWTTACLAGGRGPYGQGVDERNLSQFAWHEWPEKKGQPKPPVTPQPVRKTKPNDFGLYDMPGNVWEFCQERVKLGGSYSTKADECKADSEVPGSSGVPDTGFRPVKTIED